MARECVRLLDKIILNNNDCELFLQALEDGDHGRVAKHLRERASH